MQELHDSPVSVRVKLSGLWATVLFLFAFVDIFSLYRPDVRAGMANDTLAGFDINQTFLFWTTIYILPACLMVALCLVLPPRENRIANIVLAVLYALTIIGGAIGEWTYYVVGSAVEVALLVTIVATAVRWPREEAPQSALGA